MLASYARIATHFVPSHRLKALVEELETLDTVSYESVDGLIRQFEEQRGGMRLFFLFSPTLKLLSFVCTEGCMEERPDGMSRHARTNQVVEPTNE